MLKTQPVKQQFKFFPSLRPEKKIRRKADVSTPVQTASETVFKR